MADSDLAPLEKHIYQNLVEADATAEVVVALSGGIDSKVLLHALVKIFEKGLIARPSAIHVNHGLQQAADDWQQICQQDCDHYQVPLQVFRFDLAQSTNANIEASARQARYQAFESTIKPGQWLLMAHHLDDQAETLLLRLFRGSGVSGVAAIPQQRALAQGHLLRPMLDVPKSEIQHYAKNCELDWIEDPSNSSSHFTRNFIRHEIFPKIAEKWPGYAKTMSRFSRLAAEHNELAQQIASEDLSKIENDKGQLSVNALVRLSRLRQKNLLYSWGVKHTRHAPSSSEVEQVIKQLEAAQHKSIQISFSGLSLRSYHGILMLVPAKQPEVLLNPQQWLDILQPIKLPNQVEIKAELQQQVGLRAPDESEKVWIKSRQGGERCLPDYREKSTELKKIYQELAVPPWLREWLPLVFYNEQLVAVPGIFIGKEFISDGEQPSLKLTARFVEE